MGEKIQGTLCHGRRALDRSPGVFCDRRFVKRDLILIREVVKMDDIVDGLFDTIKKELIELISQAPETGEQAVDLLMIAKYFEGIGDHVEISQNGWNSQFRGYTSIRENYWYNYKSVVPVKPPKK